MWKTISIFTSYLLISVTVLAGNGDLDIQLINNNKIGLNPGSTTNIVIMLINNSDTAREFHLKINTPKGWSQLNDYSTIANRTAQTPDGPIPPPDLPENVQTGTITPPLQDKSFTTQLVSPQRKSRSFR